MTVYALTTPLDLRLTRKTSRFGPPKWDHHHWIRRGRALALQNATSALTSRQPSMSWLDSPKPGGSRLTPRNQRPSLLYIEKIGALWWSPERTPLWNPPQGKSRTVNRQPSRAVCFPAASGEAKQKPSLFAGGDTAMLLHHRSGNVIFRGDFFSGFQPHTTHAHGREGLRLSVCPVIYWTDISMPLVAAGIMWLYDPKIRAEFLRGVPVGCTVIVLEKRESMSECDIDSERGEKTKEFEYFGGLFTNYGKHDIDIVVGVGDIACIRPLCSHMRVRGFAFSLKLE
ncbi:hypothetical protein EVAR_57250_1 [Eumeta japonica]|uniref:Uncharacterized protein n=1 Tax=Eumeta variegata TaxID=151549 RepID=A0A4C1YRM6_EUMVA|nr:hypothetical protein EVAR_57250_1 [Eumeta japonica]